MPWGKRGINIVIPSVIWQPRLQVEATLQEMPENEIILDVGAGGRKISDSVLGVDFFAFPNTAVVADIHHLPFKDESVGGIFCTGTLEHVEDPSCVMMEIKRVLKKRGIAHIEVPFMQPYHADPVDYWRWTLPGLKIFLKRNGFEEIRSGSNLGPASALNALIIAWFQSWFSNKYIRKLFDLILSWFLFPFKYLDVFLIKKNSDMPSGDQRQLHLRKK